MSDQCTAKKARSYPPWFVGLRMLIRSARRANCTVRGVPRAMGVRTHCVLVNGHLCSVRHITHLCRIPKMRRAYVRAIVMRESLVGIDVLVVCARVGAYPTEVFVIPVPLLVEKYFAGERRLAPLYLPMGTDKGVRGSPKPPIDFWRHHREAWHLLSPPRPLPPPYSS